MRHVSLAFSSHDVPLRTLVTFMTDERLVVLPHFEGQLAISPFRVILWPACPTRFSAGGIGYAESMSYWRFVRKEDWI
jgi:hypothetical protein